MASKLLAYSALAATVPMEGYKGSDIYFGNLLMVCSVHRANPVLTGMMGTLLDLAVFV